MRRLLSRRWADRADVYRRIASAQSLLLCVDYDGTLTPIAKHPSQARLSIATKQLLNCLANLPGVRVVVVSGRAIRDLKRLVGIRGLCYVGNHGLELQGPGLRYLNPVAQATRSSLKRLAAQIARALQPTPGVELEDKGLTLSIHWRNIPRSAHRTFHRLVAHSLSSHLARGAIRVTRGKRVIEIRPPVTWDKGRIITWLLQHGAWRALSRSPFVVYLGDDQTDEDAFRTVNRRRGLSVLVGRPNRRTAARFGLRGPADVTRWLQSVTSARTP